MKKKHIILLIAHRDNCGCDDWCSFGCEDTIPSTPIAQDTFDDKFDETFN
jgi:hypothetical protein